MPLKPGDWVSAYPIPIDMSNKSKQQEDNMEFTKEEAKVIRRFEKNYVAYLATCNVIGVEPISRGEWLALHTALEYPCPVCGQEMEIELDSHSERYRGLCYNTDCMVYSSRPKVTKAKLSQALREACDA